MLRNNERKSGSAKRNLKHAALGVNVAKQFPIHLLDFLVCHHIISLKVYFVVSRKNEQKEILKQAFLKIE